MLLKPSLKFLSHHLSSDSATVKVLIRIVSFSPKESVHLDLQGLGKAELVKVYNPLPRTPRGGLDLKELQPWCPVDIMLEFTMPAPGQKQLALFKICWSDPETGEWEQSYESFATPESSPPATGELFDRLARHLSVAV